MKAVVMKSPVGNARERFEAMRKGKPIPPKVKTTRELPEDVLDTFIDKFAVVLARQYKEDMKCGKVST